MKALLEFFAYLYVYLSAIILIIIAIYSLVHPNDKGYIEENEAG